jgi:Ni/Co efflux regulator RcnB
VKVVAVNWRPSLLARLATAAGACAALLVTPALAQEHHHDRDGYRDGRWGDRGGPREDHRNREGWDQRRYNGYWLGPRWYSGAPGGPAYQAPGFRPGFVPWRRGAYLPPAYRGYVMEDYGRYHLRRPPYGYEWVQVGGECLLISIATGMIFDVVTY